MDALELELARKAEAFIELKYPDFKPMGMNRVVEDMGDHWEFYYQLPAGMIGGTPVVVINKSDNEILRSYRTQ